MTSISNSELLTYCAVCEVFISNKESKCTNKSLMRQNKAESQSLSLKIVNREMGWESSNNV